MHRHVLEDEGGALSVRGRHDEEEEEVEAAAELCKEPEELAEELVAHRLCWVPLGGGCCAPVRRWATRELDHLDWSAMMPCCPCRNDWH